MRLTFLLFLMAILPALSVSAQERASARSRQRPFVLGVTERLQSAVLGETRTLNIYLPQGYAPDSTARYPVIYLLDGAADEDFIHVTGVVQFLTMIGRMPPTIVVGIANVDRRRDFSFPSGVEKERSDFPTTGGSEKFISFLEQELRPFIDRTFKTSGNRTLIGQSFGALLASEILLKKPGLFNQYIVVSPSLWWSAESLLRDAPKLLRSGHFRDSTKLYVAVGEEGEQMKEGARKLVDLLKSSGGPKLSARYAFMPEENHLTILHHAVYQGLEALYPLPAAPPR